MEFLFFFSFARFANPISTLLSRVVNWVEKVLFYQTEGLKVKMDFTQGMSKKVARTGDRSLAWVKLKFRNQKSHDGSQSIVKIITSY